ncbi:hypothetical protein Tco_0775258 [Tanacetum coccineum]
MRTSKYGKSDAIILEDPTLRARNPVKEILLKFNLHDHKYNIMYCKMVLTGLKKFKLEKAKSEASLLKAQPSFPNVYQLTELLVKSLNPELAQLPTNHDFSASIPIELNEIPAKLEEFQSSILVLPSKVDALENIKLDLLAGLLALPKQIYLIKVQLSKLNVLVSFPSLLNKVVEDLDRFASVIELASQKASDQGVPSIGPTSTHPVSEQDKEPRDRIDGLGEQAKSMAMIEDLKPLTIKSQQAQNQDLCSFIFLLINSLGFLCKRDVI